METNSSSSSLNLQSSSLPETNDTVQVDAASGIKPVKGNIEEPNRTVAKSAVQKTARWQFKIQMKEGQTVRSYQHELAGPGIKGENYIICAPTNSGKTLVAALVIANHLEKNSHNEKIAKVVVVVKTRILADQQTVRLKEYIPAAQVECSRGTEDEGTEGNQELPSVRDALSRSDITVCTAGKLVDGLKKKMISMKDLSLLVLDECHNTEKGSNYAQILHAYLEQKLGGSGERLPQIVGLTATPGVGKNPGLDPGKEIDKLITLCAHMDATSGIKPVEENIEELNRTVPKAEDQFETEVVEQEERRQPFIRRIEEDMKQCENFLNFEFQGNSPRWSQEYEQKVKSLKAELEESDNPDDKHKISSVRVLECLTLTLRCYIDLPYALATTPLKQYDELEVSISGHDEQLRKRLTKLKSDLSRLPCCENPILEKLKNRLVKTFQRNPKSEGIVFVRTREQAKAISEWIVESNVAREIKVKPHMLLGHKRPEEDGPSMSDAEQKAVLAAFRSGECNLLVATSVAEEGLDIKHCNLVISLHISSARSKAQMQGRARAEDSEIVTIVSKDPKKLYKDILNDKQLLLTEHTVRNDLPRCYGYMQSAMLSKQLAIVENLRKQREAEKVRMSTHPANNVVLKCKKCKVVACRGSDLYIIDNTNHCVAPGDALNYETVTHHKPGFVCLYDDYQIEKLFKVHCNNCGQSWGALGTWRKSGKDLPVLKCEQFNFYINGILVPLKQWKRRTFELSPLSEWFAQNNS